MRSRWSPSVFDDRHELTDEDIDLLLRAAQWSPSWGNSQPWSFVVLRRGTGGHQTLVSHLARGNAGWVPRASIVVLGAAQTAIDPAEGPDAKPVNTTYAFYDLGQAVAHLTLQAHSMGLFAHQFAGFDQETAARELGVPGHLTTPVGIAIGVRGDPQDASERDREREQRPRERTPLSQLAHLDQWGERWGRPNS